MGRQCSGCNKDLKSWESVDIVCNRCGKSICNSCGVIDMGVCLCIDCNDNIEDDNYKCYSCDYYKLEDSVAEDYPVCRNKDSECYRNSIYYISLEEEKDCKFYKVGVDIC